jgi:hypothetical protein
MGTKPYAMLVHLTTRDLHSAEFHALWELPRPFLYLQHFSQLKKKVPSFALLHVSLTMLFSEDTMLITLETPCFK